MLRCYPVLSFHLFDTFDLDGAHNNINYTMTNGASSVSTSSFEDAASSSSYSANDHLRYSEGTATLKLPCSRFLIRNAAGETLYYDGQSFSGSLEVLEEFKTENGPDIPSTLILTVKASDSFEYHNLNEAYTSFCVISENTFGSISGEGIQSVTFDSAKKELSVNGEKMTYSAWLDIGIPSYEHFYLKGENSSAFSIYATEQGVATRGVTGTQECGFADIDSIFASTTQLSFAESSEFDLQNVSVAGNITFLTNEHDTQATILPIGLFSKGDTQ